MIIDERGRQDLTKILDRAMEEVLAVQKEAGRRLCSADAEGISYSVSILGYPSIGGMRKVDPAQDSEEVPESTERRKATTRKGSKKKAASEKIKAKGKGSARKAAPKSKRRKSAGK